MKTQNILLGAAVTLCVAGIIGSCMSSKNTHQEPAREEITATEAPTAVPVKTLSVTATGDCTFGVDVNASYALSWNAYAEKYGTDYFMENVRSIFEEDDLTIVNFEGTLTTRGERQPKTFAFRGDPSFVNALSNSSVEAANLANNHSLDYGTVSLEDTKMYLDEAGILNCRGVDNVSVSEINGVQVGLVGINYLNDQMRTELEPAIQKAHDLGAELIILSIHWGIEKATAPTPEQVETAHRAIDLGVDLVIGTHPHVLQGIEKYNGRYICYSLGNFSFGGNNAPSDMDTAIFRQKFTLNGLEVADDDNVEVIPCRISSSNGYNDYRPTPAEGETRDRIINKITSYTQSLGGPELYFR